MLAAALALACSLLAAPAASGDAPLRDPFAAPVSTPSPRAVPSDLIDPFAHPMPTRPPRAPHDDLRDPFAAPAPGHVPCVRVHRGVPLQRPQGLAAHRCPEHAAPLRDPFVRPSTPAPPRAAT